MKMFLFTLLEVFVAYFIAGYVLETKPDQLTLTILITAFVVITDVVTILISKHYVPTNRGDEE